MKGKKMKRMLLTLMIGMLCLPVMTGSRALAADNAATVKDSTATAKTTTKSGLIKEKGKYYYYKKGVRQKNIWKTIRSGSKKYRYYFGKNGAACAGTVKDGVTIPAVKKIKGATYAFDNKGHMLTGIQVIKGKFYVFSSNGKLNSTRTSTLRKASVYEADANKLKKLLALYGAKLKKIQNFGAGCFGDGEDVMLIYSGFMVGIFNYTDGRSVVLNIYQKS